MNLHAPNGLVRAETIEVVTDAARLAEIGPAWDALWSRTDGLIFQSHAWISGWWHNLSDVDLWELRIGVVWNGDRLEAIMPLCVQKRRGLRFLEWAANSYSDYEDVLVAPGYAPEALHVLWDQLTASGGFDIALINRLLPTAQMQAMSGRGGVVRLVPNHRSEISHRVSGEWTTGNAWFESQSKKPRQNYRRGKKSMAELGDLRFRLLDADEAVEPVLERLSALKRQWMDARGHSSALFEAGDKTLAALVDAMAQAGVLRIFVLELDGLIVAISVNFVQHRSLMAFVTTYDPAFERLSPGTLLMNDYIMWAFENRYHVVDFLCGAEAFKSRFATQAVRLSTLIAPGSILGRGVLLGDMVRHRIAKWRAHRSLTKDDGSGTA